MTDIYSLELTSIDGTQTSLGSYRDKVLLIVNVASKCGFTPQYEGLEKLYREYKGKGLVILGFPCNQFARQEPEQEDKIGQFCRLNYGVSFPLFAKTDVIGDTSHPLYVHLKKECPGLLGSGAIKWNFTKFLLDRTGKVIKRFAPSTSPDAIEKYIVDLL